MKRLYLLRHAQAMPIDGLCIDAERQLTPKGKDDAKALGGFMRRKNYKPDLIICSTARRTQQTQNQVIEALGSGSLETRSEKKIYDAYTSDLFSLIQNTSDTYQSLMLIGHNPAIYELAVLLSNAGSDSVLGRLQNGYQPASLSVIDLSCDTWESAAPEAGTLIELVNPMDYNAPATPARWT